MGSQPGLPHWLSFHPPQRFRKCEEGIQLFKVVLLACEGAE